MIRVPKAPRWWVVFAFGVVWNVLIQCWWASGLCVVATVACYFLVDA